MYFANQNGPKWGGGGGGGGGALMSAKTLGYSNLGICN